MKIRNVAYSCLLSSLLLGCGKSDPYDPSKMDLKPTPAKISSERHTGAFAEGVSLNMTSALKPLDPLVRGHLVIQFQAPRFGRVLVTKFALA